MSEGTSTSRNGQALDACDRFTQAAVVGCGRAAGLHAREASCCPREIPVLGGHSTPVVTTHRPASRTGSGMVLLLELLLLLPAFLGCFSTATTNCPETEMRAETGLARDARQVLRCVHAEFPEITTFHGVREDSYPDHPEGRAIDIMIDSAIPDYKSREAVELGDRVVAYLQARKEEFRVHYIIWQQQSWSANRAEDDWRPMEDRASDNANHLNHIHVTVLRAGDEPGERVTNAEKPPPRTTVSSTPTPAEDTPSPGVAGPQIVGARVVEPDGGTALTQICPGDQVQVVAEVVTTGASAGVTLSISGATSSGPTSMQALTTTEFRSGTIGIYDAGTSSFTIEATDESGGTSSAQASLTMPSADECGQVTPFATG
ncbi:hypothetical protein GCM10009616_21210 [Microlunatus lacustris]